MKVDRVYDPVKLNRIVNHPDILPYVAPGYEEYDLADFILDRENIVLRVGPAFSLFECRVDGEFEGHFLFPPEWRGKRALSAAKKMLQEMFTTYDVSTINGHVPRGHRAARVLTRALGFQPVGASRNNADQDCVHYVLRREEWDQFSE